MWFVRLLVAVALGAVVGTGVRSCRSDDPVESPVVEEKSRSGDSKSSSLVKETSSLPNRDNIQAPAGVKVRVVAIEETLTGLSFQGRKIRAQFASGLVLDEVSGLLDFASTTGAMIEGRWFPLRSNPAEREVLRSSVAAGAVPWGANSGSPAGFVAQGNVPTMPGWERGPDGVERSLSKRVGYELPTFP